MRSIPVRLAPRLGIAALLAIAACATGPQKSPPSDEPVQDDPHAIQRDRFGVPRIDDPAEPFNRAMSGVNHGLIVGFLNPLCHGWRAVTGEGFRQSFTRFFLNLRWPVHLCGNLLQARFAGAWHETERFGINTTVGVLGFFDPARERWGIEPEQEDIGRAFAGWGWEHSDYLVLPYFGPSTNRDALALPFDLLLNPISYVFGAGVVEGVNNATDKIEAYFRFVDSNYDPYERGRYVFMLDREWRPASYEAVISHDRSVETLGAAYLSFEDEDFPRRREERTVHVPQSGRDLAYDLWLQKEPAPLVCILPGLGGHRRGASTLGLAEMVHRAGCSAVAISNAMNWEFIRDGASVDVPGYAPADAADVHRVLGLILADVERKYPGRVTKRALLGISLGAFHTLFIAASDAPEIPLLPKFDAYVAINPPVRLAVGLEHLDAFHDVTLGMPSDQRKAWVDALIGKVLAVVHSSDRKPGDLLPFDRTEAEFLIGMAFRATLNDCIVASQDRKDLGVLKASLEDWRRTEEYDEASAFSFAGYLNAFGQRYWHVRDPMLATADQLLAPCDLRPFQESFRANPKILVFTNENDFLLEPADLDWLRATFGPARMIVEPEGGHLGNLYEHDVQQKITDRLMKLLD